MSYYFEFDPIHSLTRWDSYAYPFRKQNTTRLVVQVPVKNNSWCWARILPTTFHLSRTLLARLSGCKTTCAQVCQSDSRLLWKASAATIVGVHFEGLALMIAKANEGDWISQSQRVRVDAFNTLHYEWPRSVSNHLQRFQPLPTQWHPWSMRHIKLPWDTWPRKTQNLISRLKLVS